MTELTEEKMESLQDRADELILQAQDGRRFQEAMRYIAFLAAKFEAERDEALAKLAENK